MPVIVLIAVAAVAATALSGLDRALAAPAAMMFAAVIVAASLASRRSRVSFNRGMGLFFPAAAGVLVLSAAAALGGAQALNGASAGVAGAIRSGAPFLMAGLAGFAVYSAAYSLGRTELAVGFMLAPPAAAAVMFGLGGGDPIGARHAGALGACALIALFTVSDEVRRRPALGAPPPPPLTRRLFAPMACLITTFALLVWEGALAALIGLGAGILAFLAGHAIRARRSRLGGAILPIVLGAAIGAALLGGGAAAFGGGLRRVLESAPMLTPALESVSAELQRLPLVGAGAADAGAPTAAAALRRLGLIGVGAAAFVCISLVMTLSAMKDGGRRPSRGMALALGVSVFALTASVLGDDFSAPNAGLMVAAALGLAASFRDQRRPGRNRGEP
ncbi:MAG: hypothetical protein GC189_12710 [Alphaproteobacteria bacterium]|nr:hypothetical protein [Alphaproteobacteria bacterium]